MRILKIAAVLALMAGSLGLSSTAEAQPYDGRHGHVERVAHRDDYRRDRYDRRRYDDRRHRDWRRHKDWRRHEARRHHSYKRPRHCWTEWRHHRRVRVCR